VCPSLERLGGAPIDFDEAGVTFVPATGIVVHAVILASRCRDDRNIDANPRLRAFGVRTSTA